ncbi:citrate lyase subunit beta [Coccidioides immitis RMSCC 3703]|uniref:Citrate lyase subunit beta n=1 Tax=Coccidioides immitis RMSCC 3703 TaxID=454286 RepID=A0A0J8TQD5_COCIT|nr:citrate lyase subunit beta [Coccidioides immitis RMSCC 3703]
MAVTNTLRRALLYVPGSSKRMLDRAATMTVDCAAFDLEDSVTISHKDEARELVRRTLDHPKPHSIHETAVRINSVGSGLAEKDLTSMLDSPYLTTIVVPKVDSASDLRFVHDMHTRTPSLTEFLYARSAIVTAARAHNIPSVIDLVCTTYARNPDTDSEASSILKQEAQDGKRLGFNGKQCIHPSQVAPVQAVFSPEPKELVWAVRVSIADEKAARQGRGAWTLDGKMIDAPVVGKAKAIVRKAEQCGMNVKDLIREWHDQEPE